MKQVWITGGKGFIGRNLARYLATKECIVFGIGHGFWNQQDFDQWSYQSWSNAEIEFSNLDQLASQHGQPNIIYHLAGGSAVGPSIKNPYEDFQRTVDTTARLLEWVRYSTPKAKVVGISSAAVYGAGKSGQIKESDAKKPFSPYGFHKSMLESLFQSYKETFNLNVSVVRLFSVYGAGLEKQLLWDTCNKIDRSTGNFITMHGSGNELRDWLHVDDAVKLLELVGNKSDLPTMFMNGGTGIGTNIDEIVRHVISYWGHSIDVIFSGETRPGDPQSLIADISLAKKLGFEPTTNLNDGIEKFVAWYKERNH